jgi:DNA-directed RNA polymerase specialized sigma24 family protein
MLNQSSSSSSSYLSQPNQYPKRLLPQQAEALAAFKEATENQHPKTQKATWQWLKKWVQKRLYPWLNQYSPIAEDMTQEGLIALWVALQQPTSAITPSNNQDNDDETTASQLAYYWQLVSALEQKARTLSQKEIRHRQKQATFSEENTLFSWEEQLFAHSSTLQTEQALKALDAEVADVAHCITHLFNQLKKRASLGEKALWFLRKRFQLDPQQQPTSTTNDPEDRGYQAEIAETWGVSQQAVSSYEKRLLKQCRQWLLPYYPF